MKASQMRKSVSERARVLCRATKGLTLPQEGMLSLVCSTVYVISNVLKSNCPKC